ncbi:MAG: endonuclease/exonuclease/phosphatase family protein [Planctomycetes bacterium]|nr:endonuclease/exonuclease/phosphatase family protein [Planctomycetota bacterium]
MRTFALLVAAVVVGAPAGGEEPARRSLRVLTYNIHHGEGTDGKLDLERIAKVISDTKPDLVAVQEVDRKAKRTGGADQTAELARFTGLHGRFGRAIDFQGGEYGQAVLSRFPVRGFKVHELPNEGGREQRIAAAAEVQLGDKGPALLFVSTHLDHQKDDLRQKQAAKLDELFGKAKGLVILAGDLNATPDSKPLAVLAKNWKSAETGKPLLTIPVEKPTKQIDFVLHRPADGLKVTETRVLAEAVASDHRAVLVVLELPE